MDGAVTMSPATLAAIYDADGPRSKRAEILHAAIEEFGRVGYESAKWASVAERVGIGQPALYYYFESKAHCLLVIMRLQLERSHARFVAATSGATTAGDALGAAVTQVYDVSEHEALQIRVLQSHIVLLANRRGSPREEEERLAARALVRRIEDSWTALLERGMDEGSLPRRDARVLALAVLGLVVGMWRWYRPATGRSREALGALAAEACLRMVDGGRA